MEVEELASESGGLEAFPLLRELRPELDRETYLGILSEIRPRGYRLFGVRHRGRLVSVAGVEIQNNLYDRIHLRVHEMVTTERERSRGFGEALMRSLEAFARRHGCAYVVLSSGVARRDAHRFYRERLGYEHRANVFMKRPDPG